MSTSFVKAKRHILTSDGTYQTLSYWSNSESVEMNNGSDLESTITSFKQNSNLKSNNNLVLAEGTNDEVTMSASQLTSLLELLNLTTWNGGDY